MRKKILGIAVIALLVLNSCSKAVEETKFEKFDLTMTMPKLETEAEYTDLKFSERDTDWARYDFNIGDKRVNVIEISETVYPTDLKMLEKVVAEGEDYVGPIESKKLANGAFGIIYKMKGSDGSEIKNYLFYFKKGTRFFRMEPVFNSDLEGLDEQIAAYETMK